MKLEEEIKQKLFRSEYQKLNLNLLFTNNWVQNQQKKFFDEFGLTPQQYNVLRILRGSHPKPYTTSQIRERMLDKMSDASRIVDRLIQKELVERKTCLSDRRLVDVVITQKGIDIINQSTETLSQLENIFRQLTEAEAKTLNKLLDKLRG